MNNGDRMWAMGPRRGKDTGIRDWDRGSRKIMEALGAEWVMGTVRARRKWRKQNQGGDRDTEKQSRVGWRQGDQSRVGWGIRSRTGTRTQGAAGDSGNGPGHQDQGGGTRQARGQ